MPTVETEANGDSRRKGPSLVGSLGSLCQYKRLLVYLGCSSWPSTKYFFPHCTLLYFTSFVPITQQAGQAVLPYHVSLYKGLSLSNSEEFFTEITE
jgi:hypothetical protein